MKLTTEQKRIAEIAAEVLQLDPEELMDPEDCGSGEDCEGCTFRHKVAQMIRESSPRVIEVMTKALVQFREFDRRLDDLEQEKDDLLMRKEKLDKEVVAAYDQIKNALIRPELLN